MKLSESIRSDRGVSPVIGVILMVAITVILAAVIGSFVLGIGGDVQKTPQASLTLQENPNGDNKILHQGGDTLDLNEIEGATATITANGNTQLDPGETWKVGADTTSVTIVHNPSGNIIAELEV